MTNFGIRRRSESDITQASRIGLGKTLLSRFAGTIKKMMHGKEANSHSSRMSVILEGIEKVPSAESSTASPTTTVDLHVFTDDEHDLEPPLIRRTTNQSEQDLLLFTSDFLEDYNTVLENERNERLEELAMRNKMIESDVQEIIDSIEQNGMLSDSTFEPEAVEAIGIAANRVSYLRKFYDALQDEYIYFPSVAATILNGSLTGEVSNHYFGSKDIFPEEYCKALQTAAESKTKPQDWLNDDADIVDLAIDLELDESVLEQNAQSGRAGPTINVVRLGRGISPKACDKEGKVKFWSEDCTRRSIVVRLSWISLVAVIALLGISAGWPGTKFASLWVHPNLASLQDVFHESKLPIPRRASSYGILTTTETTLSWRKLTDSSELGKRRNLRSIIIRENKMVSKPRNPRYSSRPIAPNLLY